MSVTGKINQSIIVFGHEKGGTGKSTLAIHVAIGLKYKGYTVGVIDLDARQGTTIRFLNRRSKLNLLMPDQFIGILHSNHDSKEISYAEDMNSLQTALNNMKNLDFIIMDTRGSNSNFTQLGISVCNKLITPINDSIIDIDMLISIDNNNNIIFGPYTNTVWEQKKNRNLQHNRIPIDWYLVRNRVSPIPSQSTARCLEIIKKISQKIGCHIGPSITERIIYREMENGKVLFDIPNNHVTNILHTKGLEDINSLIELVLK